MNVKIFYCKPWGYYNEASRIEEELTSSFSEIEIHLIEGKFSQFTILLNDKEIFNKTKCQEKFPQVMETTNLIKNKLN